MVENKTDTYASGLMQGYTELCLSGENLIDKSTLARVVTDNGAAVHEVVAAGSDLYKTTATGGTITAFVTAGGVCYGWEYVANEWVFRKNIFEWIGVSAPGGHLTIADGTVFTLLRYVNGSGPSSAQLAKIELYEKFLFQENSQVTLTNSNVVQTISHNPDTNELFVGTADGTDVLQNSQVVSYIDRVGTPTNDNIKAIDSVRDAYTIGTATETVIYTPDMNLREELLRVDEQQQITDINRGLTGGSGGAGQTGSEIKSLYEAEPNTNAFTDADKNKVDYITVTQAVNLDTIESDTAINNNKQTNVDTDLSVSTTVTTVTIISSDGVDAVIPASTSLKAGVMTASDRSKLDSIETGATTDQTGAEIKIAYEGEANTNEFSDSEKAKLAALESSHFKGSFISKSALDLAYPTAALGDYANVDTGIGANAERYIWDDNDAQWVPQLGGSTVLTDAQIKTQYENNANTNAFTDTEKANLANQSGVNTGDQDLSGYLPNTTTTITPQQASDITSNKTHALGDGSDHSAVEANTILAHQELHTISSHTDITATGSQIDAVSLPTSTGKNLHTHESTYTPEVIRATLKFNFTITDAKLTVNNWNTPEKNTITGSSINTTTGEFTLPAGVYEFDFIFSVTPNVMTNTDWFELHMALDNASSNIFYIRDSMLGYYNGAKIAKNKQFTMAKHFTLPSTDTVHIGLRQLGTAGDTLNLSKFFASLRMAKIG